MTGGCKYCGPNFENKDVVDGLAGLGYNSGNKFTIREVYERRGCLCGFSPGDPVRDMYSLCNQLDPFTDPYWKNDRENLGPIGFQYMLLNGWAHEYFHHFQRAHKLGNEGGEGNGPGAHLPPDGMPTWFVECTAQITPGWIMRDYFDGLSLSRKLGLTYADVVAGKTFQHVQIRRALGAGSGWYADSFRRSAEALQGKGAGGCTAVTAAEERYGGTNPCDWHLMAAYLMHITSPKVTLISIHEDMWRLGFRTAFKLHAGMTMNEFYKKYEDYTRSVDPNAPAPDWVYPPKAKLAETVDFWSIKSGPLNRFGKRHSKDT